MGAAMERAASEPATISAQGTRAAAGPGSGASPYVEDTAIVGETYKQQAAATGIKDEG